MYFLINVTFSLGIVEYFTKKKKKADYNHKMAECVHVPKLPEILMGQASFSLFCQLLHFYLELFVLLSTFKTERQAGTQADGRTDGRMDR